MTSKSISIDLITIDAGTQMRAGTRLETVREYEEIATGAKWRFESPLIVFFDGQTHYLADGFHRYEACRNVGRSSVMADVREGAFRDAIKFALSANQNHGLRRSNEDKRKAVEFVLADAEWSKLSSRAIADLVGVSDKFVGSIRDQVRTSRTSTDEKAVNNAVSEKRTGKDGKEYTAPTKPKPTIADPTPTDQYEDVPDEPDPPKPEPTKAESDKMRAKAIKAYHDSAMRLVDEHHASLPNAKLHDEYHKLFRRAHALMEGWK